MQEIIHKYIFLHILGKQAYYIIGKTRRPTLEFQLKKKHISPSGGGSTSIIIYFSKIYF